MTEQLLPCPFCGLTELDGPHISESEDHTSWWIECPNCEIIMERDTSRQVVTTWNQRTDGWQPIETACDLFAGSCDFDVLVYSSIGGVKCVRACKAAGDHGVLYSHWRPLPSPPETK